MIAASRSLRILRLAIISAFALSTSAMAAGNAPVGGGGSCSYSLEGDGTVGQQQAYNDGLYTCLSGSSTWAPEAFMVGGVLQSGSAPSCSSTYAGMLQWTGSLLQYCNGSSWTNIGTAGGAGITLGTSASVTNPQRSGDATTGLFSPATGAVAVSSGGTEMIRVNATGVGIGTTSPQEPLHVYQSTSGIAPEIVVQNPHGSANDGEAIDFVHTGTYSSSSPQARIAATYVDSSNSQLQISLWQDALMPVITIHGPGYPTQPYVGVGPYGAMINTFPATPLHVEVQATSTTASMEAFRLSNFVYGGGAANGTGVNQSFYLESTANNDAVVQAGEIEVAFDNATDSTKSSSMRFYTIGPSAGAGSNSATERMRISGSGYVGIGTTSPSYLLHVGSSSASGIVAELQNSSGACTYNPGSSSVTVTCSSDARLKRDVVDSEGALAWLASMRVRDFTWKRTGERRTGVVAQEMLQAHPDMVHTDKEGYYTVDEPNPWRFIEAFQEQQKEIEALRSEVDALKRLRGN